MRTPAVLITLCAAAAFAPGASAEPEGDQLRPRRVSGKSLEASSTGERDRLFIVVKTWDDSGYDARDGRLRSPGGRTTELARLVDELGAEVRRSLEVVPSVLDRLRREGQSRTGEQLADLTQFFTVRLSSEAESDLALSRILAQTEVENAYFALRFEDTTVAPQPTSPTPDLTGFQGYTDPAPVGIDIAAAHSRNLTGQGVTVANVEASMNLDHEEFQHLVGQVPPVAAVRPGDWGPGDIHHGAASLGVIAADDDNGIGIDGMAPDAKFRFVPRVRNSNPFWSAPQAVMHAVLKLQAGDVLLIEIQTGNFEPFETGDLEFAIVRQATALGIHVVQPAGNGNLNLNFPTAPFLLDPATGTSKFDRNFRDSGSIFVGAALSALDLDQNLDPIDSHSGTATTNGGLRVDTYAWGENVATAGYGPLDPAGCDLNPPGSRTPGPNQYYTNCYSGTSSAGAVITGPATVLQQHYKALYSRPLGVRALRNLLSVGTRSGSSIGQQPDLSHSLDMIENAGVIHHVLHPFLPSGPLVGPHKSGTSVSAGDVDGDGVPDIVAGATGPSTSWANTVNCWSGATGQLLWTVDKDPPGDWGRSIAGIGDLDLDGAEDFAVGAVNSGGNSGYATVISGADGSDLIDDMGYIGYSGTTQFGTEVSSAGDANADGWPDFAVGDPNTSFQRGTVSLYSGAPGSGFGGQAGGSLSSINGPVSNARFGTSLALVGDQGSDGREELLIGAPGRQSLGSSSPVGTVTVRDLATASTMFTLTGEGPDHEFGYSVANAGDVDGDGVDDIVVGAPYWKDSSGGSGGAVYIFRGGTGAQLARFVADGPTDLLGWRVTGAGDFDGDSTIDVAATAIGTEKLIVFCDPLGAGGPVRREFSEVDKGTSFGSSLAFAGDVSGDGNPDLVVGAPRSSFRGRVFAFGREPSGAAPTLPRIVAAPPVIEACDTSTPPNGQGGGGLSPDRSAVTIQGGVGLANTFFTLSVTTAPANPPIPGASALLPPFSGSFTNAKGEATSFFGPFPSSVLLTLIGAEYRFQATFATGAKTNQASVTIFSEFNASCQ